MLNVIKKSDLVLEEPYLIFRWQQSHFAISLNYVIEVMNYIIPTPLPSYPNLLRGIVFLGGEICPVLNVRGIFMGETKSIIESKKLVLLQFQGYRVVFDVDKLCGIHNINLSDENPLDSETLSQRTFYTDKFTGVIIDIPKLWEFSLKLIKE